MEFVGLAVAKSFPGYGRKKFKGTVTGVREPEPGVQFFGIQYEDGDEEEVELRELKRILLPADGAAKTSGKAAGGAKAAGTGAGRKRKQTPDYDMAAQGGREPAEAEAEAAAAVHQAMQGDGEQRDAEEPPLQEKEEGGAEEEEEQQQEQQQQEQQQQERQQLESAAKARPSSRQAASPSSERGLTQQVQGIADEVALHTREQELGIRRYPAPQLQKLQQEEDPALRSRVVTCGNVCYTSALRPAGGHLVPDEAPEAEHHAEFEAQAHDVLAHLEQALEEAGSSKDLLLTVNVLLKDLPLGRRPFGAAWNKWANPRGLPVLTLQESYLGRDEILVSVAATAAVPSRQYP